MKQTIEELIEGVREAYSDSEERHKGDWRYKGWEFDVEVNAIVGILETKIPKKVLNVRASNKSVKFGQCPNCNKDVTWIDFPYFCGHKDCGQALSWGKSECE